MMVERFNQDARNLIVLASEHARRLGHRYIDGEHVALALTTIKQGLVPPILAAADAPTAELRTAI